MTPFDVDVIEAVCVEATAATVAVKLAELEPADTVTLAGATTDELLLARLTESPPEGAAAVSATVQASVPAPEYEAAAQEIELRAAVEFVPSWIE